jgi:Na+-translocating ferredoxin:NAD+ oxidoreductase RnfC subunit
MKSSTPEEITEKLLLAKSDVDSEVRDSVEQESSKPVQTAHSKAGIDAERIRSSIAKLTSNSTNELEKLITELEALQEFLKSETRRVQGDIESVLDGIKIIVEAITPWKTACVADEQNNNRPNGRDRIKRWP